MAAPTFDLWLIRTNAVYRGVPYNVVADWVQQARLAADDMVRPAGTQDWGRVDAGTPFAAYLPRAEPARVGDRAEALEPVELELAYRRRPDDEDEDVDMIPLIDVSLVLLVFFMLTSSVAAISSPARVPEFSRGFDLSEPQVRIDVTPGEGSEAVFAIALEGGVIRPGDSGLSRADVLKRLDEYVATGPDPFEVHIAGDRDVDYETIRDLTADLNTRRAKTGTRIAAVRAEVEGKE